VPEDGSVFLFQLPSLGFIGNSLIQQIFQAQDRLPIKYCDPGAEHRERTNPPGKSKETQDPTGLGVNPH
jgi:hypothetical protein